MLFAATLSITVKPLLTALHQDLSQWHVQFTVLCLVCFFCIWLKSRI